MNRIKNNDTYHSLFLDAKKENLFSTAFILTVISVFALVGRFVAKENLKEKQQIMLTKIQNNLADKKGVKAVIQRDVLNGVFERAYTNIFLSLEPLPVLRDTKAHMDISFPKDPSSWSAGQHNVYDWVQVSIEALDTGQKSNNQFLTETFTELTSSDLNARTVTQQSIRALRLKGEENTHQ